MEKLRSSLGNEFKICLGWEVSKDNIQIEISNGKKWNHRRKKKTYGLGVPTLHAAKNLSTTYSKSSLYLVPLHPDLTS